MDYFFFLKYMSVELNVVCGNNSPFIVEAGGGGRGVAGW